MFYGAVVVPVGSNVLESDQLQGWITRSVTNYLNAAGLVALIVWGVEILTTSDLCSKRRRFRWATWTLLLLLFGLIAWLHIRMDALLDVDGFQILDRPRFRVLHSWYLTISTIHWAGSLVLLATTLLAWRAEDCKPIETP